MNFSRSREVLAAAGAVITLAACSSSSSDATTTSVVADVTVSAQAGATTASTAAGDPYDEYLRLVDELGITDAPEMTRDDAQLRAMLGCGKTWAPATVDAALQQAYAGMIDEWKQQGLCNG